MKFSQDEGGVLAAATFGGAGARLPAGWTRSGRVVTFLMFDVAVVGRAGWSTQPTEAAMATGNTMEMVRKLIGGGDSLHTVVDVDWTEVCAGCAGDIEIGDVVVFGGDRWRHEDCARPSPTAWAGPLRRSGILSR